MRALRRTTYWLAGLALAGISTVDLATPRGQSFAGMFAAVPVLVAVNGTRRAIILAGGVALVLGATLSWWDYDFGDTEFWARAGGIVFATAVGLVVYRERLARERRLGSVIRVADVVQEALLPVPAERVGPLLVAVSYRSAADEAQVGGDFYTVKSTRWGVRGVIGDVRGHGLGAVRTTGMVIGVFREAAHEEPELDRIAARMDRTLRRETGLEGFATVLPFAVSDGGVCKLLNFGHPAPLLRTRAGRVREAEVPSGTPLGTGLPETEEAVEERVVVLAEGDELLLSTDGVLEARGPAGEFFPLAQRYALAPRNCPPADVLAALRRDLEAWTAAPDDDSALVLLRYAPRRIRPA